MLDTRSNQNAFTLILKLSIEQIIYLAQSSINTLLAGMGLYA